MNLSSSAVQNTLSRFRLLCQSLFALFCLFVGWQFLRFYLSAMEGTIPLPIRPPAVEAFLPLGALVSFKRMLLGAGFDTIHPAGLTIFLAALLTALLFRKGFCGWICPVGFASNMAERAGKGLGLLRRLPAWIDFPLLGLKYLLLGFFAYLILYRMDLEALTAFHHSPYNLISDAKMLKFFLHPSTLAGSIMLVLILLSLVLKNFWCRYLCPYGGLLGLLALLSPFQVKRNPALCIDCKKCEQACPASIRITRRETVRNSECIGCLECIPVCPAKECLTLSFPGKRQVSPLLLPTLVLMLFFSCYVLALTTGHWYSRIAPETFAHFYQQIDAISHP